MPPVDSRHPAPALSDDWPLTYLPITTPRDQAPTPLPPQVYADQLSLRIEAARRALDAGPRLLARPGDKNARANPEAWTAEEAIREVGSTLLNQIDISFPRIEGVLLSAISEQIGTDGLADLANGDFDHVAILMRNLDAVHKTSLWHCERHLG